ncbi:MAG TPA: sigma-70 family RNA polymerase sigma factor, partial [Pyrinomonadaceae bacterium]|nr:sigma-70 family RNA polymerase sigma factor [Pyrinomonadaceae bacterium]
SAVDHLRRVGWREQSLVAEFEGVERELPLESRRLSPEQEYAGKERREEIEHVVRTLPAAYRELIVLRHSHDMSYDEIAEVTGLPLGTVKNRLFRAREAMRQEFIERGITGI